MKKALLLLLLAVCLNPAVNAQGGCLPLNWMEQQSTEALMAYVRDAWPTNGLLSMTDDLQILDASDAVHWPGSLSWYPPQHSGVAWQFKVPNSNLQAECPRFEGKTWNAVVRIDVFDDPNDAWLEVDDLISEFWTQDKIQNPNLGHYEEQTQDLTLQTSPIFFEPYPVVTYREVRFYDRVDDELGSDLGSCFTSIYHQVHSVHLFHVREALFGRSPRAYVMHLYSDYPSMLLYPPFHGNLNFLPLIVKHLPSFKDTYPGSVAEDFRYTLLMSLIGCTSTYDYAVDIDLLGGPEDHPLGHFDGGDGPGQCSAMGLPNYWVNTSTRSLVVQDTDFAYSGLGPDIDLTRTYHSDSAFRRQGGMFGRGWSSTYDSSVSKLGNAHVVWKGSGQGLTFTWTCEQDSTCGSTEELIPQKGNFDKLTRYQNGSNPFYLYEEKETRLIYRYDWMVSGEYRLTRIEDRNGNFVTLSYNVTQAGAHLQSIRDAAGRITRFTVDPGGLCTVLTTPDGRQATFEYAGGELVRSIDLLGNVSNFTYGDQSLMTQLAVGTKSTSFVYEQQGLGRYEVTSVIDGLGHTTDYSVTTSQGATRTVQVSDRADETWSYTNRRGSIVSTQDPEGSIFTTEIDQATELPVRLTDAKGMETLLDYDERGNLIRSTDRLGNLSSYVYDSDDYLTQIVDPLGGVWRYEYDANHNLNRMVTPLGRTTQLVHDAKGQIIRVEDPEGRQYRYSYTAFGNLSEIQDPLDSRVRFGYSNQGLVQAWSADQNGNLTVYEYDANQRLSAVVSPDFERMELGYDCCALDSLKNAAGDKVDLQRDALLNVIEIRDPMGNSVQQVFDESNRLVTVIDPVSNQSQILYDSAGRPSSTRNRRGHTVSFEYDENGNVERLYPYSVHPTLFEYDAEDQVVAISFPKGIELVETVSMDRDGLGRVSKITNTRGEAVEFSYDSDGNLIRESAESEALFNYTLSGDLESFSDSSGTTTLDEDALGRISKMTFPGKQNLSLSYDKASNLQTMTYPGGLVVSYTYDERNRLSRVSWNSGSIELSYDPSGRLSEIRRANGTTSRYAYNASGHVLSVAHLSGSEPFAEFSYTRNALGLTTSASKSLSHRLRSQMDFDDPRYERGNQIAVFASKWPGPLGESFEYDADGNLVKIEFQDGKAGDLIAATSWEATYNRKSQLIGVTRYGDERLFTYNALGQRVAVKGEFGQRNHFYDPFDRFVSESDGEQKVDQFYIYAGGEVAALIDSAGEVYFYHFNALGSTVALTDESGKVVQSYDYDPFGNKVEKGTIRNPFTYIGALGVVDDGQGLYLMKNRHYLASTQRFIQRDPIGYSGGVNLYAYVGNSPLDYADPLGLVYNERHYVERYLREHPPGATPEQDKKFVDFVWPLVDKPLSYCPATGLVWGLTKTTYSLFTRDPAGAVENLIGTFSTPFSIVSDVVKGLGGTRENDRGSVGYQVPAYVVVNSQKMYE